MVSYSLFHKFLQVLSKVMRIMEDLPLNHVTPIT